MKYGPPFPLLLLGNTRHNTSGTRAQQEISKDIPILSLAQRAVSEKPLLIFCLLQWNKTSNFSPKHNPFLELCIIEYVTDCNDNQYAKPFENILKKKLHKTYGYEPTKYMSERDSTIGIIFADIWSIKHVRDKVTMTGDSCQL
jgi:hypothetical protein